MTTAILDVESDNLMPMASVIHCVCVKVAETGTIETYTTREALVEAAKDWTKIVTHGGLGFDFWALWKIWGIPFTVGPDTFNGHPVELEFVDTLVLSRYLWPDRQGHGLGAWGDRLGFSKTEWNDFSEYSTEMEAYCWNDIFLTEKVWNVLQKEIA